MEKGQTCIFKVDTKTHQEKIIVIVLICKLKESSMPDFLFEGNLHRNMTATGSAFGDLGALLVVTSQV